MKRCFFFLFIHFVHQMFTVTRCHIEFNRKLHYLDEPRLIKLLKNGTEKEKQKNWKRLKLCEVFWKNLLSSFNFLPFWWTQKMCFVSDEFDRHTDVNWWEMNELLTMRKKKTATTTKKSPRTFGPTVYNATNSKLVVTERMKQTKNNTKQSEWW